MILAMLVAAAVAADVGKLDWLAGTWVQKKPGVLVREMWLPPRDGAMAGVTLTTRPGKPPIAEYAKITVEPEGVTFTAVVGRQPPTPFVMLPGKDGEAVFENKAHDFPQRVFYRRCGADLCAGIEGVANGKPEREEWRYVRAKP
jgi:hypothetical protein